MLLHFVFTRYFRAADCSPVPAGMSRDARAAAMSEPTASLSGNSRASRLPMMALRRLLGCFPPDKSAEILPLTTDNLSLAANILSPLYK
jgi:hypothetical protein